MSCFFVHNRLEKAHVSLDLDVKQNPSPSSRSSGILLLLILFENDTNFHSNIYLRTNNHKKIYLGHTLTINSK